MEKEHSADRLSKKFIILVILLIGFIFLASDTSGIKLLRDNANNTLPDNVVMNNTAQGKIYLNATNGVSIKTTDGSGNGLNLLGNAARLIKIYELNGVGQFFEANYGQTQFVNSGGDNIRYNISGTGFMVLFPSYNNACDNATIPSLFRDCGGFFINPNGTHMQWLWQRNTDSARLNQMVWSFANNITFFKHPTLSGGGTAIGIDCRYIKGGNTSSYCNTFRNNTASLLYARRYGLNNGSVFDVIYGVRSTFTNGTSINTTRTYANDFLFGNGTNIKDVFVSQDTLNTTASQGLISAIKNNTANGKLYINSSNIYLESVLTTYLRSNEPTVRNFWNISQSNGSIIAAFIANYRPDFTTGRTNAFLVICPETDKGCRLGFGSLTNLQDFAGMDYTNNAVTFYSGAGPSFGTAGEGIQLSSGQTNYAEIDTANDKMLSIEVRTPDIASDGAFIGGAATLVNIHPRSNIQAFTNYNKINILTMYDNLASGFIERFGFMVDGTGFYLRNSSKVMFGGRRGGYALGYSADRNEMYILINNRTNVTRITDKWFNVSVAKQVVINTTLRVDKNFSLTGFNSTLTSNCGLYVSAGTSRMLVCDGSII